MPGEPTKSRNGDVTSGQNAGKAGSLPEAQTSTSDDIAAFVAKARAMSPHAAGARDQGRHGLQYKRAYVKKQGSLELTEQFGRTAFIRRQPLERLASAGGIGRCGAQ